MKWTVKISYTRKYRCILLQNTFHPIICSMYRKKDIRFSLKFCSFSFFIATIFLLQDLYAVYKLICKTIAVCSLFHHEMNTQKKLLNLALNKMNIKRDLGCFIIIYFDGR